MGAYLKLILPVSKIYDKKYWKRVRELNKEEFEKLGIWVWFEYINFDVCTKVLITIEETEKYANVKELSFPSCGFDELEKMQKYYKLAQRLLEIEGGTNGKDNI